jgi:tetratricopeptide (TPR) repeat protein
METPGSVSSGKRSIRIFVSSTFRDMEEDRNELMTHCWPLLRKFCAEKYVEISEIDLRWGVSEEQSTRKETLKLCLDEISACRPFFIGLLGERYGWIPGDDAFTADLREEQPWLKDIHGKSVTELEILHGVLNNPEMSGHAFFYFRDPAYAKDKGPDFLAASEEDSQKQKNLKDIIRSTCREKNIPLHETYTDPLALAPIVLKQLKEAVNELFKDDEIPDPLTREARDHEAFAEIRRLTYVGQEKYFQALHNYCNGNGNPLTVTGEPGSGKSALLANWIADRRRVYPEDYIFQYYIGGTQDSSDHWKLMRRLINEIKRWTEDPEETPHTHDEIFRDFPLWLAKAQKRAELKGVRFIVVIDALNQLENTDNGRRLGWLPGHSFNGSLRLIVSTLPGDTQEAIKKRDWESFHVVPLGFDERKRIMTEYLLRFGKKLDDSRLSLISAAEPASNPLYLKTLMDELRVTGTYEKLDERLSDYLEAADVPALLQKVINRYKKDYDRDRPGLVGDALTLLWSARRGLAETELLELLRPSDLPKLPLAFWSPLRAAIEEMLVVRNGILNFSHDFMRSAVEKAFLSTPGSQINSRLLLAEYFEAQDPGYRNCDELPWLYEQAGSLDKLRTCLLNIDRFMHIQERDQFELYSLWIHKLNEAQTMGKAYLERFDIWEKEQKPGTINLAYAANQLSLFLLFANLYTEAEPLLRRALAIHEKYYGPDHPNVGKNLFNLAHLLDSEGRLAEAEAMMRRALNIAEQNSIHNTSDLIIILDSLGQLLQKTDRFAEAEPLMRRTLKLTEQKHGTTHPAIVKGLNSLGLLLQVTNRLSEAEMLLRRALEISEMNLGSDDPLVAYTLNNLGLVLKSSGRLDEAELLMKRALSVLEKNFGDSQLRLATTLNNLGSLLHEKGRLSEAGIVLERALKIQEGQLGGDHPKLAMKLNNLGLLLVDLGKLEEAEIYLRRALSIVEQNYGNKHSDVATGLNSLAGVLRRTNRKHEAVQMRRRAVIITLELTRSNGPEHPYLRLYLMNYAELLLEMGSTYDEVMRIVQSFGSDLFEIFMEELQKLD